jgi:type II secretory pathway pseudopilin PulG
MRFPAINSQGRARLSEGATIKASESVAGRFSGLRWVAQIFNLLYRRFAIGPARDDADASAWAHFDTATIACCRPNTLKGGHHTVPRRFGVHPLGCASWLLAVSRCALSAWGSVPQLAKLRYNRSKICATSTCRSIGSYGRRQRAFTMVEIAICLGIIGFALVAIIGILPTGINVQKENREETIISQDATYFMEAIRNGAQGIDDLEAHVDNMFSISYAANGSVIRTPAPWTSGSNIVGLLSRPRAVIAKTEAGVYAISGPAVARGAKQADFGFKYLLISEITPVGSSIGLPPDAPLNAFDAAALASQQDHLYEIRLTFRWPLLIHDQNSFKAGPGRLVFRSLVSGTYTTNGNYYYLVPRLYESPTP